MISIIKLLPEKSIKDKNSTENTSHPLLESYERITDRKSSIYSKNFSIASYGLKSHAKNRHISC